MKSSLGAAWRRSWRVGLAGVAAVALGGAGLLPAQPAQAAEAKVTDAVFEWGVNKEAGSGAYYPGSCNFLSAGVSGDAGKAAVWPKDEKLFKPADGSVKILRPAGGGKTQPITWENKCQTADGAKVDTRGTSSDNFVQISGGTGTVDTETDTGTIEWKGSFTIVFYSGFTYWSVSDPKLEVTNGKGKITGTFSGYGADMDDLEKWEKLTPQKGVIADLSNSRVDLTEKGFTVTPDYAGVDSGQSDQDKKKDGWGSFPKSWVDFNVKTGQKQYWYTSGGAADPRKPTTPINVSFDGTTIIPPDDDTPPKDDDDGGKEEPGPPKPPPGDTPGTGAATMYWPVNAETSAAGFAPGTCNFLSAGVSPDNGGATVWTKPGKLYKPSDGAVRIEKPDASGTFHTATWENKCIDRTGKPVTTKDPKSQHESRVTIGKGTADATDKGIEASWKGGFTIVFYSGMTYWSISDPHLKVNADGTGELVGTASGFGADMDDLSKWEKITPETITMATFSGVDVTKAIAEGGFTVHPDFTGVKYAAPRTGTPQDRSVEGWGSFPPSWVDFNQKTGQHSYWYTSGGIADARKPAAPLTIALSADYQPPASDYSTSANTGGGDGTTPGGSGQHAPAGPGGSASGPGGPNAAGPNTAPAAAAQTEDNTAFAAAAADARESHGIAGIGWRGWALGGGVAGTAVAATWGLGWLLRRRIGLDPGTWV